MKTIDDYKGNLFHNRDIAYLAKDPNFERSLEARIIRAKQEASTFFRRAISAESTLDKMHHEVNDALSQGNFRGMPLRDKDFDYPIVDPIKWTNITLKRYKAKEIPEHDGAEMYRMQMLIVPHELEMLSGEQIRDRVLNKFSSMFHGHIAKLLRIL